MSRRSEMVAISISRAAQRANKVLERSGAAYRDAGVTGVVRYLKRTVAWPFANLLRFCREYITDREFGISTRTSIAFPKDNGTDQYPYQPVTKSHFNAAMRMLPIDPNEFTFIDLGCGKGTALFLAAKRGFGRVVGVEIVQELLDQARKNCLNSSGKSGPLGARINLVFGDAADYQFPPGPKLLFLFNPFGEETLHKVLERFVFSVQMDTRPSYLLYRNPTLHRAVLSYPRIDEIGRTTYTTAYRVGGGADAFSAEPDRRAG
jgi:SAM-dependent methyltransferase